MADQRDLWAGPDTPSRGLPHASPMRPPSGLFPAGPPRPRYREPHPVGAGAVLAGVGAGLVWLLLLGVLGTDLRGYAWWTLLAGALAWAVAAVLARFGDRGVAVGVAIITAVGWAVAAAAVTVRWMTTSDWPMW